MYPAKKCHQPWSWVRGFKKDIICEEALEERMDSSSRQKWLSTFQRAKPSRYLESEKKWTKKNKSVAFNFHEPCAAAQMMLRQ